MMDTDELAAEIINIDSTCKKVELVEVDMLITPVYMDTS